MILYLNYFIDVICKLDVFVHIWLSFLFAVFDDKAKAIEANSGKSRNSHE